MMFGISFLYCPAGAALHSAPDAQGPAHGAAHRKAAGAPALARRVAAPAAARRRNQRVDAHIMRGTGPLET